MKNISIYLLNAKSVPWLKKIDLPILTGSDRSYFHNFLPLRLVASLLLLPPSFLLHPAVGLISSLVDRIFASSAEILPSQLPTHGLDGAGAGVVAERRRRAVHRRAAGGRGGGPLPHSQGLPSGGPDGGLHPLSIQRLLLHRR